MKFFHNAQIDLPDGAHAPDPWDHGGGVQLRLDHVISRDAHGSPLSRVGDLVWDWTFCTPRQAKSLLHFHFWKKSGNETVREEDITAQRLKLIREMQYLMVLRVYHSERLLGYRSLANDLFCLGKFARFAREMRCSLRDVLEQRSLLDAFITQLPSSQCKDVARWIGFLREQITVHELGFELAVPKKLAELKKRSNDYIRSRLQTSPLPTRIYLALVNALNSELDSIEEHQDQLLAALREGVALHREHTTIESVETKGWERRPTFGPDLIAKHGLAEFLMQRGLNSDLAGLTTAVANVQRVCKLQVHTFSGMRDEEAEDLPYHCMETVKAGHGRKHYLFVGVTTKLNGARFKRTRWVTTEAQGFRAVRVAQSFADEIYACIGVTPDAAEKLKDNFPLFVATSYFPWSSSPNTSAGSRYAHSKVLDINKMSKALKAELYPVIEGVDIAELVAIDEFRDWSSEPEFAIGRQWLLKTHQLRRSLAICQRKRSGENIILEATAATHHP
jgi:hypothetical protein